MTVTCSLVPCTSAIDVFVSVEPAKLKAKHEVDFGIYFRYLHDSSKLISKETVVSMLHYFEHDDLLRKPYDPHNIRRRSAVRDQVIISQSLEVFRLLITITNLKDSYVVKKNVNQGRGPGLPSAHNYLLAYACVDSAQRKVFSAVLIKSNSSWPWVPT